MQAPHAGDHHHPPRLRLALAGALCLFVGASVTGAAAQAGALPSPAAPLSPSPPLGAATASRESVRHHIRSTTRVDVSLGVEGTPFAVAAEQTLTVSGPGDYFLTIGAPVREVEALPGSGSVPGRRSGSIVWAGFNAGRRTLGARAELEPGLAAPQLPLRVVRRGATTTFVNTTGVTVSAVTAEASPPELARYVQALHSALLQGLPLPEPTVELSGASRTTEVRVTVPLRVEGFVGAHRVAATINDRLTIRAHGKIAVSVRPWAPAAPQVHEVPARTALARTTAFILTVARFRQYERFLANPDPSGSSTTVYSYRTATRPRIATAITPAPAAHDWTKTIAISAALLVAAGGGLALWARS